jgi:spindle and centriole-associated protein 1
LEEKQKLLTCKEKELDQSRVKTKIIDQVDLNEMSVKELDEYIRQLKQSEAAELSKRSTKSQQQQQQQHQHSSSLLSLNEELRRALHDLDEKLTDLEKQTGKNQLKNRNFHSSSSSASLPGSASVSSSYTLTLIGIISALLDYLKETSGELNYEKLKQTEMNKQLDIHRKLIDGLTSEILYVKEQNEKLLNDYVSQQARVDVELDQIKVK